MRTGLHHTAFIALILGLVAPAAAQDASKVDRLERTLEEQQRQLKELQKELKAVKDAGAKKTKKTKKAEEEEEEDWTKKIKLKFFSIESTSGEWKLQIKGRIHAHALALADRGHDDLDNSFQTRRARVEFVATLYDRITLDIGLEFGRTSDADARNAFLSLKLADALKIRIGQFIMPYSDERLTSSNYLLHPERSIWVASNVGQRDIGGMVHGKLLGKVLEYWLGVFNGEGENVKLDTDDDVDFAARLEIRPFNDHSLRITGNYIYTPTNRKKTGPGDVKTVGNEYTKFLDYRSDNRRMSRRQRAGGGVTWAFGPLILKGEVNADYQERVRLAADARVEEDILTWAWSTSASFVLTMEDVEMGSTGHKVDPANPLYDPESSSWGPGAFELAVRYEDYIVADDIRQKGFATGADRVRAVAVSGHWYPWKKVRFTLNYTFSHFDDAVFDSKNHRHTDDHAILGRFAIFF